MTRLVEILRCEDDGGWKGSGIGEEENDCVVRAVSISLEIDYASAHRLFEVNGRRNGEAFSFYDWLLGDGFHLYKLINHHTRYVGEFVRKFDQGPFLCIIQNHVFAVVNGVIRDRGIITHARTLVHTIWQPLI